MEKEKPEIWSLRFILVIIVNALNGLAMYISNPIFANYLIIRGVGFEYTGIISSLLSWVALAFRPFSGAMSDRLNKKKLLIISYSIVGVCILFYAFVNSVPAIIAVRVIHGIAFAVSGTISMSFATTFIPKESTAEGISYLGLSILLGSMIGPQIGKLIFDKLGINMVFYISTIITLICLLVLTLIEYEHPIRSSKLQQELRMEDFFAKELILYVVLISILSLGNGIISYYLVDFGDSRGIDNIALFFTVYSIAMLFMKPFVGKIQDKLGVKVILYPAFVVYAIGIFILAKAKSLLPCLIAAVFKGVGQGNGTPAIQAESVKTLSPERSGVAISTCFIGQDIGNAVGPIFASFIVKKTSYENMFLIYSGLLIIGLIIFLSFNIYKNRKGKLV